MRALSKTFLLLLAVVGLASCGGGGGGSQSAFTPTPVDSITINAASTSIPTNSFTTLTVTVKKQDGTIENDGVQVNASLSPSTFGTVSGAGEAGTTASNTLSGGKTTFNFTSSNQTGTATITISVPAGTNGTTTAAVASIPITVTAGGGQDPRLQLSATATTLPVNPYTYGQQQAAPFPGNFPGSPYIAEVDVTWRHSNGQLVGGTLPVNVSVAPASTIAFSTLNTGGGDQFHTLLGSGPVNVTGGVGTIFIHSSPNAGTAVLTVTATDPDNGQTISSQLVFTVAGGSTGTPVSIAAYASGPAYVSNSGGQGAIVTARVTDGSNALITDPNGFNNVHFEIVSANSDGRLSGVNAAGQTVSGTSINVATHSGIAAVTFLPGSTQGTVQVRATADRGDNNVDNGIQDPVSATATVVVSDGKLYTLTLSSPVISAIVANSVSGAVTATPGTLPTDPNATYSLTVSATGSDRQGNPVLPGTVIKFGSIDAPQNNGFFSISGTHGNPQEGGNFFTATDGHFKTAGGGAGPGDTLIVFGKETHGAPPGNADLESAAKVTSVNSETSLNVATPFNRNDTTGVPVDNGPVLPYIIGRALTGNITSPATTNEIGTATTKLNYPVSVLGRPVAIWAQGNGTDDNFNGQSTLVTDAAVLVFPGIAPATITISPNPIPGNLTIPVVVCISDAAQNPLSNVHFNFIFAGLGIGSGKVDGINAGGVVPDGTGADGCVTTSVVTTGIDGSVSATLSFSFGDANAEAPITVSGNLILLAVPSALKGEGGPVTLTLITSNGTPVPGVQIVGTCSGDPSIGITSGPGVTDANGVTHATITAQLDHEGSAGSGSCVFTTSTGAPSATVTLQGIDLCNTTFSPTCPDVPKVAVTLNITTGNSTNITASISSSPGGLSCSATATMTQTCQASVPATTYTLTPALGTGMSFQGWSGSCVKNPANNTAKLVVGATAVTCTLIVNATP